jgi:acetyltransferase-like isoleucine patch superfamily enzyme
MKKEPVSIKERAFIGNNAIILPGVVIGEQAIVGAGAVVTKSVGPKMVVAGIPARVMKNCANNRECNCDTR